MFIFVHGLYGWGEADSLWQRLPYWGLASGDLLSYLRARGFACAAPSLSPTGSAWDRACELYAALTGTVPDYGAVHSAAHGHPRFGTGVTAPLVSGWSEDTPVDLIAHSFGGATARLLVHLLEYGAPEECSAASDASPLFRGGQGALVRSVTCIASPHNGTTLLAAARSLPAMIDDFSAAITALLPSPALGAALAERLRCPPPNGDSALCELTLAGATALNRRIRTVPSVIYRSVPCCRTHGTLTAAQRPDLTMLPLLRATAVRIGSFYYKTVDGISVTPSWAANDGLVNTCSSRAPSGAPLSPTARSGYWQVLPLRTDDHFEILGGFSLMDIPRVHRFYLELLQTVSQTID